MFSTYLFYSLILIFCHLILNGSMIKIAPGTKIDPNIQTRLKTSESIRKVWKRPEERQLNRLRHGIRIDNERSKPAKIRIIESTDTNNTWLDVTTIEGRNRHIRKMFESINHPISKLQRISFASINLGKLASKQYRPLNGDELERIRALAQGIDISTIKKKSKYKKGFARPKIKKSPLRKRKRR